MDAGSWERAKQIIAEALTLPPRDREVFVRARSGGDGALCAEVLALLAQHDLASDFLEGPPPLEEPDELADLVSGARIGPYTIVDRIGRGGMGQVFLARDHDLRRRIALKCLLTSASAVGSERARILNEARAAAAINHANVATVYHVIEHGDRVFIVMEYVEGENLEVKLRRERLPIERVVAIGRQLAAALKAAHAQGVVHRDLKPANIQVTPDGSVKVLDFGVARLERPLTPVSTRATTSGGSGVKVPGGLGGTPPYMSPEQLLGRQADERSDIFSLGVVLFELATGRRPFRGSAQLELVQAHGKGAPRADAFDSRMPRQLADVIANAMSIDVGERFQSATEVDSALEAVERSLSGGAKRWRELILGWAARLAVGLPMGILALGVVGFIATSGFNSTFGRTGAFARFGVEPWPSYVGWGVLAVFPSLMIMTLTAVIVLAAGVLLRMLESIGPIGRLSRRMRTSMQNLALAMGLDKPNNLAQALTGLGILMIVGMYLYHADLINAWAAFFNSAPIETLLPLRPANLARLSYKVKLDMLILGFGFGLFRVIQLRRSKGAQNDRISIAMLIGIILVLVMMSELPYRTLTHRDFERVDLAGARCYIIGQSADEFLILCPDSNPPRNRVIRADDVNLKRLGIIENVFEGVTLSSSGL